jgi:hypothetical protein
MTTDNEDAQNILRILAAAERAKPQDSTGKPIAPGDSVRYRGEEFRIREVCLPNPMGENSPGKGVLLDDGTDAGLPAAEISIDLVLWGGK